LSLQCFPVIGPFQIFSRQIFGNGPENPPTTFTIDKENLHEVFYSSPTTPSADLVLAQIMCRPASFKVQFSTVVHYTKEKQGTIPSVYIKTSIDQCLPPMSQDYIINACPQTEVVEIHADHNPMFSATDELHEILLRLAAKYT
jgi:pimeloyl-ACP methyl ester carboxylesterase